MECLNPIGIPLREKSISSQNINDDCDSIYSNDKKTGRWTKKEDDMLREVNKNKLEKKLINTHKKQTKYICLEIKGEKNIIKK